MKTSIYNKADHTEGYVKTNEIPERRYDAHEDQKPVDERNEVTSYGKAKSEQIAGNKFARDGYDNSGTQGKDSLSDDAYDSDDKHPTIASADSHTGSRSSDFKTSTGINEQDENHALDTGI